MKHQTTKAKSREVVKNRMARTLCALLLRHHTTGEPFAIKPHLAMLRKAAL